jgi:hypothetical protein
MDHEDCRAMARIAEAQLRPIRYKEPISTLIARGGGLRRIGAGSHQS